MVVEATGDAEAGARHAAQAIAAGIGVTMVSKEAECVVGPVLAARARKAGVGYTLVEGDQPALLIGLVSWARTLGLPIMAAGKSSEYDYVYDPVTHRVTWTDRSAMAPSIASLWALGADTKMTIDKRAAALAELPQRTVPDNCEMALVANATGLVPDRPDFHAPMARTVELPDIYKLRSEGGLLEKPGALDVFNCLRRPDEASFAGGVYVVVGVGGRQIRCPVPRQGHPGLVRWPLRPRLQSFAPAGCGGAHHHHGRRAPRPFRGGRALPTGGRSHGARHARSSCRPQAGDRRHAPRRARPRTGPNGGVAGHGAQSAALLHGSRAHARPAPSPKASSSLPTASLLPTARYSGRSARSRIGRSPEFQASIPFARSRSRRRASAAASRSGSVERSTSCVPNTRASRLKG